MSRFVIFTFIIVLLYLVHIKKVPLPEFIKTELQAISASENSRVEGFSSSPSCKLEEDDKLHYGFSKPMSQHYEEYQTYLKNHPAIHIYDQQRLSAANNKIMYNRIPKCGSETINDAFGEYFAQQKENGNWLGWWRENPHEEGVRHDRDFYNRGTTNGFIRDYEGFQDRLIYIRHEPYLDFHKWPENANATQPVYFNIVRKPSSRHISRWYYDRAGNFKSEETGGLHAKDLRADWERNMTIEHALKQALEWKNPYRHSIAEISSVMMNYLCGTAAWCNPDFNKDIYLLDETDMTAPIGNIYARDQAMKNIRENYIFVGILEQWDDNIEMLEYVFPEAFGPHIDRPGRQTFSEFFKEKGKEISARYATVTKPKVEDWAKDILEKVMLYENEIYEYAKMVFNVRLEHYRKLHGRSKANDNSEK